MKIKVNQTWHCAHFLAFKFAFRDTGIANLVRQSVFDQYNNVIRDIYEPTYEVWMLLCEEIRHDN